MELKNNELERLYAETFHSIEEGAILKGRVLAVKPDGVIVDIGYKSEGFIPAEDFLSGEISGIKTGDPIEVYIENIKDSDGVVALSKERADQIKAWEIIEASLSQGMPVEGRVVARTKGGLSVNIMGIKAFLPGSQLDFKPVKDMDSFVGRNLLFKVLKLSRQQSNLIVSHRAILEEEMQRKKLKTLETLKEGNLLKGLIKNITDYGVFVDLGGIDGLLHISDISWGRIVHPSQVFALGEEIEVLVIKYDLEQGKVTLGYKQKRPDPWAYVDEKYPVGKQVKGSIVAVTGYGVFVKIEEELEGLVHISELDWVPVTRHPSKVFVVGENVEAVVIKVDKETRRMSLSLKQLKPSPWELVALKYQVGQHIRGRVKSITDFGVFVDLPEGVDGLIHISDLSWTRHIKHPSEVLRKRQQVDVVVLNVEPEKQKIALGLKQVSPNPWLKEIPEKFRAGDEVRCRVLRITEFGIFVEMEGGVEGLVYSSEIVQSEEEPKEGAEICAKIIKVNTEDRKIGLSMKNLAGVNL